MKKILSRILILLGLILIISPLITGLLVKNIGKKSNPEHISIEMIKDNNKSYDGDTEFDFEAVEDVDLQSALKGALNYDKSKVEGLLYIPDLNLKLPIMNGLTDANLLAGAGTMKKDQKLGEGNFSLAGHNMKDKSLLFGSLMDIKDASKVYATDGEYIYEYIINKREVVPDTRIDMIRDDKAKDKPIISLMTCYHTSKTGKRFFAVGELVDSYPIENDKNNFIKGGNNEQ